MNNQSLADLHNNSSKTQPTDPPSGTPSAHDISSQTTLALATDSSSAPLAERSAPSTLPTSPAAAPNTRAQQAQLLRTLITPAIRERKARSHSFAAKLTPEQRITLFAWLQTDTIETVRSKVAAPAPLGFGIAKVHPTTLVRLKRTIENTQLNHWISGAMDATCDILDEDTSVDPAPLREALGLLLYTRAFTYTREQTNPASIDRLLCALTRLEKLKTHIAQRPNLIAAPREKTTHHKVKVEITTNPGTATPITIQATHQTVPTSKTRALPEPDLHSVPQVENETAEKTEEK
jgi:hypothetical protein